MCFALNMPWKISSLIHVCLVFINYFLKEWTVIQSNAFYNFAFKSTSLLSKAYYLVIWTYSYPVNSVTFFRGLHWQSIKKKLIIDKFYGQVSYADMYGIIRGCRWSKFSPSEIWRNWLFLSISTSSCIQLDIFIKSYKEDSFYISFKHSVKISCLPYK